MPNFKEVERNIASTFGSSREGEYCFNFVNEIKNRKLEDLQYISFQDIARSSMCEDTSTLLVIAGYLSGQVGVLEANFELLADGEVFSIDKSAAYSALKTRTLYHPETGELIENIADKIVIYYSANPSLFEGASGDE